MAGNVSEMTLLIHQQPTTETRGSPTLQQAMPLLPSPGAVVSPMATPTPPGKGLFKIVGNTKCLEMFH